MVNLQENAVKIAYFRVRAETPQAYIILTKLKLQHIYYNMFLRMYGSLKVGPFHR